MDGTSASWTHRHSARLANEPRNSSAAIFASGRQMHSADAATNPCQPAAASFARMDSSADRRARKASRKAGVPGGPKPSIARRRRAGTMTRIAWSVAACRSSKRSLSGWVSIARLACRHQVAICKVSAMAVESTSRALMALEGVVLGSVGVTARAVATVAPDLTLLQWRVIVVLAAAADGMAVSELAGHLCSPGPSVERVLWGVGAA